MSDIETTKTEQEKQPLNENEAKTEVKNEFENKTFLEKLSAIKSNISVEPILAGLIVPSMLARLAIQNLNIEKTCRIKLDIGIEACDAIVRGEGNTTHEGEIQKVISAIETWKSVIQTAVPTILVILMGAWSDRTGNRKLCILLPILGELCVCISNIISTIFFNEIPVEVTMFLEAFFPAITGGWVMMYLGVFSYISDITSKESRTFRVGLVNLCMTAGIPIGTALSGILLKVLGYYAIFAISGSLYLITFLYGFFYLKRCSKPDVCEGDENKKDESISFLDLISLVKETVTVAFKKRDGIMRKKIILTLLVVYIVYGPSHGERNLTYLYLRYRLNWDAVKYSMYSTYSIITHSVGALFSISVFSKRWGWDDSVLCMISLTSKLAGSILIANVRSNFQMFMVPIVEILNATTWTSLRSMASKLVKSEEMGKMNSLFSLVETLAALVFDPTYSAIYNRTIGVFVGTVFIFSGVMTLPAISILLWFFIQHRKGARRAQKAEEIDDKS